MWHEGVLRGSGVPRKLAQSEADMPLNQTVDGVPSFQHGHDAPLRRLPLDGTCSRARVQRCQRQGSPSELVSNVVLWTGLNSGLVE